MRSWAVLISAAMALSGCAAAIIPAVVTVAASKGLADSRRKAQPRTPAVRAAKPASDAGPLASAGDSGARVTLTSLGALPRPDASVASRAGDIEPRGDRPPLKPAGSDLLPPAPTAVVTEPRAEAEPAWAALGRYVARESGGLSGHGALLARGSSSESPRWSDCGSKPLAVLASLDAVLKGDQARPWVEALQTIGVGVIVTSSLPEADRASITASLRTAGLASAVGQDGLRLGTSAAALPALRADLASRYCVVAIAGTAAEDFPNGLLPATTPDKLKSMWGAGWFVVDGADAAR